MAHSPNGNGGPVVPSDSNFLARRARDRAECRRRDEAEQRELEVNLLAPLREHRSEWSAAWADVCAALSPTWAAWRDHTKPPATPNAPALAAALGRVGRAVLRHDEVTARHRSRHPGRPDVPATLAGRLAWVEEREHHFANEPWRRWSA